ncbi:MAG: hypothetical protein R3246_17065, partial [Acidimicrobiia bacterium]|nr:hypothetical protein [Acidimicrobiia bacterium]
MAAPPLLVPTRFNTADSGVFRLVAGTSLSQVGDLLGVGGESAVSSFDREKNVNHVVQFQDELYWVHRDTIYKLIGSTWTSERVLDQGGSALAEHSGLYIVNNQGTPNLVCLYADVGNLFAAEVYDGTSWSKVGSAVAASNIQWGRGIVFRDSVFNITRGGLVGVIEFNFVTGGFTGYTVGYGGNALNQDFVIFEHELWLFGFGSNLNVNGWRFTGSFTPVFSDIGFTAGLGASFWRSHLSNTAGNLGAFTAFSDGTRVILIGPSNSGGGGNHAVEILLPAISVNDLTSVILPAGDRVGGGGSASSNWHSFVDIDTDP